MPHATARLWPHFGALCAGPEQRARVMVEGDGVRLVDDHGRHYVDLLSSLYCVNVGHGRAEIAEAMSAQARRLEYFPIWGATSTPIAAELAERIIDLAPDPFERVFFTSGGSDSVDAAWKLARQYHARRGHPGKYKILSKDGAYHGTTMGALSVTGVPSLKADFEPLVPGAVRIPRVKAFGATTSAEEHSLAAADAVAEIVRREGPDTVGAVIVEPVQNSGGCLVSEPVYFRRLREIADEYDLLLVSDETICSWGRTGAWFGSVPVEYRPDIITTAKGLTSGYAPMGALLASATVCREFDDPEVYFNHGITFGGHPVSAAAALSTIAILEREQLVERGASFGSRFRDSLEELRDLDIVGDVRGMGMFQAVELVGDHAGLTALTAEQTARLGEYLPRTLLEGGVVCRAMHRGAPILQFAPPLTLSEEELKESLDVVGEALRGAEALL